MSSGQTSWNGAGAGIGMHVRTATNEAWCACGCLISYPLAAAYLNDQVIVTIGQNVVLVGRTRWIPNSKDYICIRKIMATYASYKTLTADNFNPNSITASKLGAQAGNKFNTFWVYNERGLRCSS